MNFLHLIKTGGFVMYPLLVFSILIWAILFERIWFLNKFKKQFRSLNRKLLSLYKEQKKHEIRGLIESCDGLLYTTYQALLSQLPTEEKYQLFNRRMQEIQALTKGPLWTLATIASAAPFVGLFGTVIGIIRSFEDIAQTGKGGFSVVAAGLSEALIATATGIIVAVVAVLLYNYLMTYINKINLEFKNSFLDIAAEHGNQEV